MEIQRKGLNRAFIVLAVLTVVLNLSSWIVMVWLIPEFRLANLLSFVCTVLPILVLIYRKRKPVSLILSVAYFAVYAFMFWMTRIANGSYTSNSLSTIFLCCDGIVISCAIGILPMLNALIKAKNKKAIAIICFILGIAETVWVAYSLTDAFASFYWRRSLVTQQVWSYYYVYNTTYYASYCVMMFAIGIGILRDAPARIKKPARGEKSMKTKSKQTALFFSIFTGVLGVDRFYLGYTVSGIVKLLTVGGAGIWALIDFIRIGVDSLRPADGSPWVEETRDENIRSIAANMQAIAEKLEKLQAQNGPAEAPKPEADGENQETHKVSLKK